MQNPTSVSTSSSHRSSPSHPSHSTHPAQHEPAMTQHPLPHLPQRQYGDEMYDDDNNLYGHPISRHHTNDNHSDPHGQGNAELVPDSQGDEQFLADFQDPQRPEAARYEEEGWDDIQSAWQHGEGRKEGVVAYEGMSRLERDGGALELYERYEYKQHQKGGDPYAMQVERQGGGLTREMSVRMADMVEEPMTPMVHDQNLATQAQFEAHHSPTSKPHPIATARATAPFNPPQQLNPSINKEHVAVQDIGGRRVLTRQAGAGVKRPLEEEEEDVGRRSEPVEEKFDPTAEIVKFDTKKMLVEDWDKIQKEIVPFLKEYAEAKMRATYDEIQHVNNLFFQLNEDARKDLEEGVKKIEEEEKKQEDCRGLIVNFAAQMEAVAAALSQFGGGAPSVHSPPRATQATQAGKEGPTVSA